MISKLEETECKKWLKKLGLTGKQFVDFFTTRFFGKWETGQAHCDLHNQSKYLDKVQDIYTRYGKNCCNLMDAMIKLIMQVQEDVLLSGLGIGSGKCCFPLPLHKYHTFAWNNEMWLKLWGMRDYICRGSQDTQDLLFRRVFEPWIDLRDDYDLFLYLTNLRMREGLPLTDVVYVIVIGATVWLILVGVGANALVGEGAVIIIEMAVPWAAAA